MLTELYHLLNNRLAIASIKACKCQRDILMNKKLLIDAHQPEETRVVLLYDQKIEEFDYENTARKQLKGNVYLARVTRVEPSLQAAFVEYLSLIHI